MPDRVLPDGTSKNVTALLARTDHGDYSDTDMLDMIELFKIIDTYATANPHQFSFYARMQIVSLQASADHRGLRERRKSDNIAPTNPGETNLERPDQPPR